MFEKDQKVSKKEYTKAAIWCNANGHYIEEVNGEYFIRQVAPPSEEEIAAEELAKAKAERADYVSKLVVTVDGMQFDGDETSQDRMARSIIALDLDEKVQWVLADNTIAMVTRAQLRQALRLAGEAQTAIWANPYLGSTEDETIEE
jgi:hypothetical protein